MEGQFDTEKQKNYEAEIGKKQHNTCLKKRTLRRPFLHLKTFIPIV